MRTAIYISCAIACLYVTAKIVEAIPDNGSSSIEILFLLLISFFGFVGFLTAVILREL